MEKMLVLRTVGTKHGDQFCVVGDQLGQYRVIQIIGDVFPDEPAASRVCINAFYRWLEQHNREDQRLPFVGTVHQSKQPTVIKHKAA